MPTFKDKAVVVDSPSPIGKLSPEPHLITKRQLAARYSVSNRTIQTWVARRIIPFLRIAGDRDGTGGMLRFDPRACDSALARFGGIQELALTQTRPPRPRSAKAKKASVPKMEP